MVYILIISSPGIRLLTGKPLYLLRPQSFSFKVVSNTFVKFLTLSPGDGAFDSLLCPGGGFLYTVIVPGGGFPFQVVSQGDG